MTPEERDIAKRELSGMIERAIIATAEEERERLTRAAETACKQDVEVAIKLEREAILDTAETEKGRFSPDAVSDFSKGYQSALEFIIRRISRRAVGPPE